MSYVVCERAKAETTKEKKEKFVNKCALCCSSSSSHSTKNRSSRAIFISLKLNSLNGSGRAPAHRQPQAATKEINDEKRQHPICLLRLPKEKKHSTSNNNNNKHHGSPSYVSEWIKYSTYVATSEFESMFVRPTVYVCVCVSVVPKIVWSDHLQSLFTRSSIPIHRHHHHHQTTCALCRLWLCLCCADVSVILIRVYCVYCCGAQLHTWQWVNMCVSQHKWNNHRPTSPHRLPFDERVVCGVYDR